MRVRAGSGRSRTCPSERDTKAPDTIGSMLDKSAHLDFTCPNCQHEWRERLDDVRRRPVRCPECDLELETAHFDRDMRDVERRLRDFGR